MPKPRVGSSSDPLPGVGSGALFAPPPAPEPAVGGRRGLAIVVMLAALAVCAVAAAAGLQRLGDIQAIGAVMDAGIGPNGPVPVLPKDVDRVLDERALSSMVLSRTQAIEALTERFQISVKVEQRVLGLALSYDVERSGDCDIPDLLPTMDFYRSGGWSFDENMEARLLEYRKRTSSVSGATDPMKVPELVEDSGAAVPTPQPEKGEEREDRSESEPASP
jgi:hypothetical protein